MIIQWKPLSVITLGQIETDNINPKITKIDFFHRNDCNVQKVVPI
jgi:hypothetical protein